MTTQPVDKLASALLYEGYALYPYRPSVKNHQRWTFGGVYPPSWSQAQEGTDPCVMQTQCLLEPGPAAKVHIRVRFLQLIDRTIGQLSAPLNELPANAQPDFLEVKSLDVGEKHYLAWQEAVERQIDLGEINIPRLLTAPVHHAVSFSPQKNIEPLRAPNAPIVAILIRRMEALEGAIEVSAQSLQPNLIRLTVRILNRTEMLPPPLWGRSGGTPPGWGVSSEGRATNASGTEGQNVPATRDDALMRTMISTHTILTAQDAKFVSLTDPPPQWAAHATQCTNLGAWPVLVGTPPAADTMLSSPIIVEDYPKIAPESPGDLFDATEIDEILTLRIMTLTDEEKRQAAAVDDRVRQLLERTQSLARDELMSLHATFRGLSPAPLPPGEVAGTPAGEGVGVRINHPPPGEGVEGSAIPDTELPIITSGEHTPPLSPGPLKVGDPVRLHPLSRADIMDMALDGKAATIVAIERDFENRTYVAVTVDDDPGKDLGLRGQPGHRFFFGIEEVEPLNRTEVSSGPF